MQALNTHSGNGSTVLVTGGAGYIGSHAVLALHQAGYRVIVLDNLVYGHRDLIEKALKVDFMEGDIGDRLLLNNLFQQYSIDAVMHFAAYAYVGESVNNPAKYYRNNVVGTLTLLEAMVAAGVNKIVFSSTCATYGVPKTVPISEDHPQAPINPYGTSKLMVEQILQDFDVAYGLKSVRFRYFNAAGADPEGRLGEDHNPETHLIPLVLQTALGLRESISVFGTDYSTPDGTCIRDYIHVSDLADAHVLGINHLLQGGSSEVFNLGNGNGFSVKQVIEAARTVTGQPIPVIEGDRRPGDPSALVGSAVKAREVLGWAPQYSDIEDMIRHAWAWHQHRHGKVLTYDEASLTR
jgi:UDP-glucose 4-epimerase